MPDFIDPLIAIPLAVLLWLMVITLEVGER